MKKWTMSREFAATQEPSVIGNKRKLQSRDAMRFGLRCGGRAFNLEMFAPTKSCPRLHYCFYVVPTSHSITIAIATTQDYCFPRLESEWPTKRLKRYRPQTQLNRWLRSATSSSQDLRPRLKNLRLFMVRAQSLPPARDFNQRACETNCRSRQRPHRAHSVRQRP
jgi:hypothetical protein